MKFSIKKQRGAKLTEADAMQLATLLIRAGYTVRVTSSKETGWVVTAEDNTVKGEGSI